MVADWRISSAVSRAILKPVYQFGIPSSDPQTLKSADFWCNVSHCSLSQNHESDVLSYSECKIAKIFRVFAPGPHWGSLTAPPEQGVKYAQS